MRRPRVEVESDNPKWPRPRPLRFKLPSFDELDFEREAKEAREAPFWEAYCEAMMRMRGMVD